MAFEAPIWTRPDDPLDIGKFARFDGTNTVWAPEFGTLQTHATPTGATKTLSLQTDRIHRVQLDANLTLSLSNVPTFCRFHLWLYHTSANSTAFTVTWWSGLEWVDDAAGPILPSNANAIALIEFWTINGGTQTLGIQRGNFFP